jgi:hypothetical protein
MGNDKDGGNDRERLWEVVPILGDSMSSSVVKKTAMWMLPYSIFSLHWNDKPGENPLPPKRSCGD